MVDSKNILVAYRSRYGHSRSYAHWLAEDLDAKLVNLAETPQRDLNHAAAVVLVIPMYAGSLLGAKKFAALASQYPNLPIAAVAVGASDPNDATSQPDYDAAADAAFSPELQARTRWFRVRGGLDYPKMKWHHRTMMRMVVHRAKKAAEAGDPQAQAMVDSYGGVIDFRDRAAIEPIVAYVRELVR